MKFFYGIKTWAFALISMLCMPAFASNHKQVAPDWGIGIIQGAFAWAWNEIVHLWSHIQLVWPALSTGNIEFFLAQNSCAPMGLLTSLFFTRYGLLALGATSILIGVLFKRRRSYNRLVLAG